MNRHYDNNERLVRGGKIGDTTVVSNGQVHDVVEVGESKINSKGNAGNVEIIKCTVNGKTSRAMREKYNVDKQFLSESKREKSKSKKNTKRKDISGGETKGQKKGCDYSSAASYGDTLKGHTTRGRRSKAKRLTKRPNEDNDIALDSNVVTRVSFSRNKISTSKEDQQKVTSILPMEIDLTVDGDKSLQILDKETGDNLDSSNVSCPKYAKQQQVDTQQDRSKVSHPISVDGQKSNLLDSEITTNLSKKGLEIHEYFCYIRQSGEQIKESLCEVEVEKLTDMVLQAGVYCAAPDVNETDKHHLTHYRMTLLAMCLRLLRTCKEREELVASRIEH